MRVSPELPTMSGLCKESPAKEVCKSTIIVLRGGNIHTPSAMDSLTKVGFYFFITNYMKRPIPPLHTHEEVRSKTSGDSSVSQGQASALLHKTELRHSAHPRHLLALLPASPALYPPPEGGGVPPHQYWGAIKPIKVRLPSYIAPHAKLYCFTCEAILV